MQPVLCQTAQRDCHTMWHEPSFNNIRELWFKNKEASNKKLQGSDEPKRGLGRPKGSKIRRNVVKISVLHCEQFKLFSLYFYMCTSLYHCCMSSYVSLCVSKGTFATCGMSSLEPKTLNWTKVEFATCGMSSLEPKTLNGAKVELVERRKQKVNNSPQ